jgi:hypothetical protein
LAERTAAKVATASTSVPNAVASEAAVAQSIARECRKDARTYKQRVEERR